jgi:hemerythrin superfamily protein
MDIFDLMMEDHKKVANLFRQLHGEKSASRHREQLFAHLKEELELHSYAEEQVWYPALQEMDVTYNMALDAIEDHQLIVELLDELSTSPKDDAAWDDKLETLEESVEDHVEEEESELFEAARQLFSADRARALGERFRAAKQEHMVARNAK